MPRIHGNRVSYLFSCCGLDNWSSLEYLLSSGEGIGRGERGKGEERREGRGRGKGELRERGERGERGEGGEREGRERGGRGDREGRRERREFVIVASKVFLRSTMSGRKTREAVKDVSAILLCYLIARFL